MAGNKRKPERYLYMMPEEANRFVLAAYDHNIRVGLLFDITWSGGFRISETMALRPVDFNFPSNEINVATLKRKDHPVISILMPAKIMQIAKKVIEYYEIKPNNKMFNGSRIYAWRLFKVIAEKAKLDQRYSPHALRHSHGIVVRDAVGGDLTKIANRLRHASYINSWRYLHLTDEDQSNVVKHIEQRFGRKP